MFYIKYLCGTSSHIFFVFIYSRFNIQVISRLVHCGTVNRRNYVNIRGPRTHIHALSGIRTHNPMDEPSPQTARPPDRQFPFCAEIVSGNFTEKFYVTVTATRIYCLHLLYQQPTMKKIGRRAFRNQFTASLDWVHQPQSRISYPKLFCLWFQLFINTVLRQRPNGQLQVQHKNKIINTVNNNKIIKKLQD
jgi:hypothetical protein